MRKLVKISSASRKLILLSLTRLGLSPSYNFATTIVYRLDYRSGLTLQVGVIEIEDARLGIFRTRKLKLVVTFSNDNLEMIETLWSEELSLPKNDHDIKFLIHFANKFVAITRACADLEGAGECLSLTQNKPHE
jgi:hypothetical protein